MVTLAILRSQDIVGIQALEFPDILVIVVPGFQVTLEVESQGIADIVGLVFLDIVVIQEAVLVVIQGIVDLEFLDIREVE